MNCTELDQTVEEIAGQASEWLSALENADEQTSAGFVSWLKASPRHVEELFRMIEMNVILRQVLTQTQRTESSGWRERETLEGLAVVHIIDDDEKVRGVLERLLRASGYTVRGFASCTDFINSGEVQRTAGCIILEPATRGMNGYELQEVLTRSGWSRPTIFVARNADISASVRALKAGAINYLGKPVDETDLLISVDEAMRMQAVERAKRDNRVSASTRLGRLTPRERDVFDKILAGKLNKQIATELGIVEKTIKVHRSRMMRKLEAASVVDLIHLAIIAGIGIKPQSRQGS